MITERYMRIVEVFSHFIIKSTNGKIVSLDLLWSTTDANRSFLKTGSIDLFREFK